MNTTEKAKFIHIGGSSWVNQSRITNVISLKQTGASSGDEGRILYMRGPIINATHGYKIASFIILDTGHRILSTFTPDEIKERMRRGNVRHN